MPPTTKGMQNHMRCLNIFHVCPIVRTANMTTKMMAAGSDGTYRHSG